MIFIVWDFTVEGSLSYQQGVNKKNFFVTNCLDFFSTSKLKNNEDIIIVDKEDCYISVKELLENKHGYTDKEIRKAHNLRKMLVAGKFKFKRGAYEKFREHVTNVIDDSGYGCCGVEKVVYKATPDNFVNNGGLYWLDRYLHEQHLEY